MVPLLTDPARLWSIVERAPGFLVRNVIAEWPFYLMMLVALGLFLPGLARPKDATGANRAMVMVG